MACWRFSLGYFIIFLSCFYPNLWYFDCYYAHCLYWCTLVAAPDSLAPQGREYCYILVSPPAQNKHQHFIQQWLFINSRYFPATFQSRTTRMLMLKMASQDKARATCRISLEARLARLWWYLLTSTMGGRGLGWRWDEQGGW